METKYSLNLLFFFLSLMINSVLANECLNIIRPFYIQSKIGVVEKKIEKFYFFSSRNTYPTKSISRPNVFGENKIDIYYSKDIHYEVQVHSFKELKNKNDFSGNGFYTDYLKQVNQNIDYVLGVYKNRRDWSDEFLKDVRSQAISDADRTQYIIVKKYDDPSSDGIWGTLKIVRSTENNPYESILPLEKALDIQLPFNHGFKFEPGNFAVAKDHYKDSMAQLILHLSRLVKKELKINKEINPKEDLFYTYADRESKLMYKSLGFNSTAGFENPIQKDGKDWWVLSISGEDLANLPQRLRKSRGAWSDQDQELFNKITSLFDSFAGDALVDTNLSTNSIVSNLVKGPSFVNLSESEAHLYKGEMIKKFGISFDQFGDDGFYNLPIPINKLPLKDGDLIHFNSKEMTAVYKDGKLIFDDQLFSEVVHYELAIDPFLKKPKKLIFEKIKNNKAIISFSALFHGSLDSK